MNKIMMICAVCFAVVACPAFAAPVYFTDRASFDAATGGGLNFESFEEDWSPPVATKTFAGFTVSETGGVNLLAQARNYTPSPFINSIITDGTGALWYDDNNGSISTFFSFTSPITAFGLDIAADTDCTVTIGGSVSDSLVLTAVTSSFWGVIDTDGITSITFSASGGPNIGFDAASYGLAMINVVVDIKPGSCPNPFNSKSKGSVPVAIVGTADLDVTTIDPTSITLNGVAALEEFEIIDVTEPDGDNTDCFTCFEAPLEYMGDGYDDLVVKFDTQALAAVIGEVPRDTCVTLELNGETNDGVPIMGSDSVITRKK